jgi:hypothetical protein
MRLLPDTERGEARRGRNAAAMGAVFLLATLTACGSSSSGESSSGGSGAGGSSGSAGSAAGGSSAVAPSELDGVMRAKGDSNGVHGTGTVQTRAVIMTGRVSLTSKNLTRARADLDRLLARYGGYVDREETVDDDRGRVRSSTLELRLPSASFDVLMDSFENFATVVSTSRHDEDVTTEVIDVDARVRTAEISLRRLQKFLGKAANVNSVIRLESEISSREADLASLRAQQRYLRNQTSLATIEVSMTRTAAASPDDPLAHAGFLTGLRNGLHALLDLALIGATVAGALLPFALVLALVLAPLLVLLRSRRHRRTSAAEPEPET